MSRRPNKPLWRKIVVKAAPVIVAGLALSLATTVGGAVDRHVTVTVHVR